MKLCGIVMAVAFALFSSATVQAQNLVPNDSFESYTVCPTGLSQLNLATPWASPSTASPDYYNVCAGSSTNVGVPANDFGSQAPNAGNAYAGFILRPVNEYREYLQIPLTAPLLANVTCDVSFYVSLSDESQWAIDKIGAYLSAGLVGPVATSSPLPYTPQIANPVGTYITDKLGWTLISGTYIATGGEDHLVIGNFVDNASTTPITGLGGFYPGSYYYIDDVAVTCGRCDHLPDGSACTPTVCPDQSDTCRPQEVLEVPGAGLSVTSCDCVNSDECYLVPGHPGIAPRCEGLICPVTFEPCQLTATQNPNGSTTYECCAGTPMEEACCLPNGECMTLPLGQCANQNGSPLGPGSQCSTPEACCFRGGGCQDLDPLCCKAIGGSPEGSGTVCQGLEACCLPDGSCQEMDAQCCDGSGVSLGTGSVCENDANGDGVDDACCSNERANSVVIDVSTGINDGGGFIPINSPDDNWTVSCEPVPVGQLPRPAAVIDGASVGAWATIPGTQWISANFFGPIGEYCYESCFCLAEEFQNASLIFQIHADDSAGSGFPGSVSLNGNLLTVDAGSPPPSFIDPPASFTITDQSLFQPGTNCLQIVVNNGGGAPTGFNLAGQVLADNARCCCQPAPSGLRCESKTCAIDTERCVPIVIEDGPCEPQATVLECDCIDPKQCQLRTGPDGPTCFGTCPALKRCNLRKSDEDGDGIDEFHCSCGSVFAADVADIDRDGDVDLIDHALMQNLFTGPD